MKSLLLIFACLLAFAGSASAQPRLRSGGESEPTAAPNLDAELRWQAQQQAATLADLLYLSAVQTRHLQESIYEKLWQLQPGAPCQALTTPAQAAALRNYYCSLVRVLSPGQYGGLLRLENNPSEPNLLARQ